MPDNIESADSALILTIQSHVAYGYVGNRAAVVPLNAMGHETIAVHTVQLSNHTGYGAFQGDFFSEEHLRKVLSGIKDRGIFPDIRAVLTGYLGEPTLGHLVLETVAEVKKQAAHDVLYVCDPVMGDVGRGFFVKEGIPAFFKNEAIAAADIITPNQFELEYLSGQTISNRKDALHACQSMHDQGVAMVLLTSLEIDDTPADHIQMLLSTREKQSFIVTTPKLPFDIPLNGSGDTTAALFCGYLLQGDAPHQALEKTASAIYTVFEKTKTMGRRELALIQSQQHFAKAPQRFSVKSF